MALFDRIKGSPACAGMELSTNTLKIAVLARQKDRIVLKNGLVVPLPIPKLTLDMEPEKRRELGEQIAATWDEIGIKCQRVAFSLPGKFTLVGRLKLPTQAEAILEEKILFTLDELLSFTSREELNINHFVYSRTEEEIDVLYVVVKKEVIALYEEIFSYSQLELSAIYPTPFALANVTTVNHPQEEDEGIFVVVDVGAYETNIIAMRENRLISSFSLEVGGALVTYTIAKELGLSFKEAEKMKLLGKGEDSLLRDSAHKLALDIQEGITRCIQKCEEFSGISRIEKICFTGGGAHTPFLLAELSSLNMPKPEHLFPIRRIDLHPDLNPAQIYELSPQLAVAIGAALSRV